MGNPWIAFQHVRTDLLGFYGLKKSVAKKSMNHRKLAAQSNRINQNNESTMLFLRFLTAADVK